MGATTNMLRKSRCQLHGTKKALIRVTEREGRRSKEGILLCEDCVKSIVKVYREEILGLEPEKVETIPEINEGDNNNGSNENIPNEESKNEANTQEGDNKTDEKTKEKVEEVLVPETEEEKKKWLLGGLLGKKEKPEGADETLPGSGESEVE